MHERVLSVAVTEGNPCGTQGSLRRAARALDGIGSGGGNNSSS